MSGGNILLLKELCLRNMLAFGILFGGNGLVDTDEQDNSFIFSLSQQRFFVPRRCRIRGILGSIEF